MYVRLCTQGGGEEEEVEEEKIFFFSGGRYLKFDRSTTDFYRSRQLNPPEMVVSQVCAMVCW